jgi:hypothetical protein
MEVMTMEKQKKTGVVLAFIAAILLGLAATTMAQPAKDRLRVGYLPVTGHAGVKGIKALSPSGFEFMRQHIDGYPPVHRLLPSVQQISADHRLHFHLRNLLHNSGILAQAPA